MEGGGGGWTVAFAAFAVLTVHGLRRGHGWVRHRYDTLQSGSLFCTHLQIVSPISYFIQNAVIASAPLSGLLWLLQQSVSTCPPKKTDCGFDDGKSVIPGGRIGFKR